MFHNVDLQWRFLNDNMTSYISIMDQWMEHADEFHPLWVKMKKGFVGHGWNPDV
jgi:hypothetical protein